MLPLKNIVPRATFFSSHYFHTSLSLDKRTTPRTHQYKLHVWERKGGLRREKATPRQDKLVEVVSDEVDPSFLFPNLKDFNGEEKNGLNPLMFPFVEDFQRWRKTQKIIDERTGIKTTKSYDGVDVDRKVVEEIKEGSKVEDFILGKVKDTIEPLEISNISDNKFYQYLMKLDESKLKDVKAIELIGKEFSYSDMLSYLMSGFNDKQREHLFDLMTPMVGALIQSQDPLVSDVKFQMPLDEQFLEEIYSEMKNAKGKELDEKTVKGIHAELRLMSKIMSDMDPDKETHQKSYQAAKLQTMALLDSEKMFQLHKENPDYWTGERLAGHYGITRDKAWRVLIKKEKEEAERTGKPFNPAKEAVIFGQESIQTKIRRAPEVDFSKIRTEEEAYKKFLDVSYKTQFGVTTDDDLPTWAKYPFQQPTTASTKVVPETREEKPVRELEGVKNESGLGTDTARKDYSFIEMSFQKLKGNERQFLIREQSGKLREMDQLEEEFAYRKGTFKKSRKGMAGKTQRERNFRRRKFV